VAVLGFLSGSKAVSFGWKLHCGNVEGTRPYDETLEKVDKDGLSHGMR
jgi:hypothetical protein